MESIPEHSMKDALKFTQIVYSTWVQQQVAKANPRANLASTKSGLCHK